MEQLFGEIGEDLCITSNGFTQGERLCGRSFTGCRDAIFVAEVELIIQAKRYGSWGQNIGPDLVDEFSGLEQLVELVQQVQSVPFDRVLVGAEGRDV